LLFLVCFHMCYCSLMWLLLNYYCRSLLLTSFAPPSRGSPLASLLDVVVPSHGCSSLATPLSGSLFVVPHPCSLLPTCYSPMATPQLLFQVTTPRVVLHLLCYSTLMLLIWYSPKWFFAYCSTSLFLVHHLLLHLWLFHVLTPCLLFSFFFKVPLSSLACCRSPLGLFPTSLLLLLACVSLNGIPPPPPPFFNR